MMQKLSLAALLLGLGIALSPGMASAFPRGGFPAGAHLYGFGIGAAAHGTAKGEPAKAAPALADPLDFLKGHVTVPSRELEYPFLNPPRCETQSVSDRSCAAAASPIIGGSTAGQSSIVR